jgi:hypothetical protein
VMVALASCTGSASRAPAPSATAAKATAQACSGVGGYAASSSLGTNATLVLGRIAIYPDYSQPPVPVPGQAPWKYWEKRGLLILAGTGPVTISVPASWRQRVAITYGTNGIVGSLVLPSCPQPSGVWDGYAGGFYLRTTATCVPLVFTVGNRSVTVPFGIAGRCG